jgi:uncharacterized protein (DUF433 family)
MRGRACIRGLRIPAALVVSLVATGMATAEILEEYPELDSDDVRKALEHAAALAGEESIPLRGCPA